jgi:hypothetical protein
MRAPGLAWPVKALIGTFRKWKFKDFVVCKALDVISGNCAYRKYLHQCCENGEEWALKVSANVASVSLVIKELHALVDRVRRLPNSRLGKVCGEIVSSMHSPVRVIPGWSTCGLDVFYVNIILCVTLFA